MVTTIVKNYTEQGDRIYKYGSVEFYYMQMLQSDWLSHRTMPSIGVQWLDAVNKMATFSRFAEVSKEYLETYGQIDS